MHLNIPFGWGSWFGYSINDPINRSINWFISQSSSCMPSVSVSYPMWPCTQTSSSRLLLCLLVGTCTEIRNSSGISRHLCMCSECQCTARYIWRTCLAPLGDCIFIVCLAKICLLTAHWSAILVGCFDSSIELGERPIRAACRHSSLCETRSIGDQTYLCSWFQLQLWEQHGATICTLRSVPVSGEQTLFPGFIWAFWALSNSWVQDACDIMSRLCNALPINSLQFLVLSQARKWFQRLPFPEAKIPCLATFQFVHTWAPEEIPIVVVYEIYWNDTWY